MQALAGQFRRCKKKGFMKSSLLDSEHTMLRYKNSCQEQCMIDQKIFTQKQTKGLHEARTVYFPLGNALEDIPPVS